MGDGGWGVVVGLGEGGEEMSGGYENLRGLLLLS